jgi:hypothetical protein
LRVNAQRSRASLPFPLWGALTWWSLTDDWR